MLCTREYNREHAVEYAGRWAYDRNPLFENYTGYGGDCTNFVSQCIFAGCCVMNFTETFGWYYLSPRDRAPAWTGVQFLYNFLTSNAGEGPFAVEVEPEEIQLGDIIMLGNRDGAWYHSVIVTGFAPGSFLVSAHTNDEYNRRLDTYNYYMLRFLHIVGARVEVEGLDDCFTPLIEGRAIVTDMGEITVPETEPMPEEPARNGRLRTPPAESRRDGPRLEPGILERLRSGMGSRQIVFEEERQQGSGEPSPESTQSGAFESGDTGNAAARRTARRGSMPVQGQGVPGAPGTPARDMSEPDTSRQQDMAPGMPQRDGVPAPEREMPQQRQPETPETPMQPPQPGEMPDSQTQIEQPPEVQTPLEQSPETRTPAEQPPGIRAPSGQPSETEMPAQQPPGTPMPETPGETAPMPDMRQEPMPAPNGIDIDMGPGDISTPIPGNVTQPPSQPIPQNGTQQDGSSLPGVSPLMAQTHSTGTGLSDNAGMLDRDMGKGTATPRHKTGVVIRGTGTGSQGSAAGMTPGGNQSNGKNGAGNVGDTASGNTAGCSRETGSGNNAGCGPGQNVNPGRTASEPAANKAAPQTATPASDKTVKPVTPSAAPAGNAKDSAGLQTKKTAAAQEAVAAIKTDNRSKTSGYRDLDNLKSRGWSNRATKSKN